MHLTRKSRLWDSQICNNNNLKWFGICYSITWSTSGGPKFHNNGFWRPWSWPITHKNTHIMALLGVGCSPILMASYYIFARNYSPKIFATLAAIFLGIGSSGTLIGASPLTYFVGILGWREAVELIGMFTIIISVFLLFTVKNPVKKKAKKRIDFRFHFGPPEAPQIA